MVKSTVKAEVKENHSPCPRLLSNLSPQCRPLVDMCRSSTPGPHQSQQRWLKELQLDPAGLGWLECLHSQTRGSKQHFFLANRQNYFLLQSICQPGGGDAVRCDKGGASGQRGGAEECSTGGDAAER